ncbi:cilia- and flagella-associated protein 61-like [Onthophagus taurus]|uniref:cilia- and flagella-associated protein 61-like n=1 Tax=Onthophagus taurus TaxID=166361 RepID=UPI0039BE5E0E
MLRNISFFETNVNSSIRSSSFFNQQKIWPITRCRAALLSDLPILNELVDKTTDSHFGMDDIKAAYELSYITLVAETRQGEIVAGVFFNNFPNLRSIPPDDWVPWIIYSYNLNNANSSNTLFVHLAVYNQRYLKLFLEPVLEKVFKKFLLVQYVIVIIPAQKKFVDFLPLNGLNLPSTSNCPNSQKIMLYLRQDYDKHYKLRQAVIEDNDDLIPLIDTHSERLKKMYGEFYMAEIISDGKSNRHTIVTEYEGLAVGIIIYNEIVNLEILKNYFQLECFYGLRKHVHFDDKYDKEHYDSDNYEDYDYLNEEDYDFIHSDSVETVSRHRSISNQTLSFSIFSSPSSSESYSILIPQTTCSSETSPNPSEIVFKGVVEGKFSSNLLHFNDNELQRVRNQDKFDDDQIKSVSYYATLNKLAEDQRYNGPINAFTLELLAAWPEHEKSLVELLQAGFELFPNKDYCVLCIPSTAPFFQLLTKMFIRVTPTGGSNFAHELYVVHRNSLYCRILIRKATLYDVKNVKKLLSRMRSGLKVFQTFHKYLTSHYDNHQTFVVLANNEIVGVVNVKDLNNSAYIFNRYQVSRMTDLSKHKPCCFGRIKHFALSPIFQRHSRWLLLELHRLTDYSLLIHLVEPDEGTTMFRFDPLACVLNELMPVLPARVPEFDTSDKENCEFMPVMMHDERPYAVYMSTPMYCGLSRFEINTKIVVVGASEIGLSFLIELIFNGNPNLHTIFNNVTLVSTHGLPKFETNATYESMFPVTSDKTSGHYLSLLSLATYVNVVSGVMSEIDRKAKTITVNSTQLPYDMLFLTCGTQFQPVRREFEIKQNPEATIQECPENVFVINTTVDAMWAMSRIEMISEDRKRKGNFIVYGNCIEAYCCLEGLLKSGINPEDLIFIIPPYSEDSGTFEAFENSIEEVVQNEIKNLGIEIYKNYSFCDWTFDKNNLMVTSIMFQTNTRTYSMNVKAAFMYQRKSISKVTFTAFNKANLIFDGALVISPNYETNDPNIFAAGRITKYPRRYYADHMRHNLFNQGEIGRRLARMILKKLVPSSGHEEDDDNVLFKECSTSEGKMLVPWFGKPVEVFAQVPTKIQYLLIRKPGVPVPMDIASMDERFGHVMTTGDCNDLDKKGYFLLHLNKFHSIETIIAVSKKPIQRNNLTLLWGKHEALFNNLEHRFKIGLIKDFFKFFSQPWIQALFDDGFEVLEKNLNDILLQTSIEPRRSIIEDVVAKIEQNHNDNVTPEQYDEIFDKFEDSEYQRELEKMVMEFLAERQSQLPMYATPGAITMILGAFEDSPLFTAL